MATPISTVTQSPPVTHATAKPPAVKQQQASSQAQPVAKPTVRISAAAQSALQAAVEESTETSAQTATEARAGDPQAQRLLAAHAASKS